MFKDIMDLSKGDRDQMLNYRNDNNIIVKQSDFSIDHILNRAGTQNNMKCDNLIVNKNLFHNYHNNAECTTSDESNNFTNCAPMLSWLQYTRYRPPKLPSKCCVAYLKSIYLKFE